MSELSVHQMFETARAHHQAGRLTDARDLYQQILAREPGHADTLHLCGIMELQQGRHDVAIQLMQEAIRIRPDASHFYCNIGQAYLNAGRLQESVDALNKALAMRPAYPDALNNLGNTLRTAGEPDNAIAAYQQAIGLERGFVEAYTNLADVLRETGRLDESIAACRTALALRPNSFEAFNHMGSAFRDKGQFEEAMAAYREALLIHGDSPEVHNNVGTVRRLQGQLDQAILAFQHALEIKPDFATAQNNLAIALRESGKLQESLEAQRRAVEMMPQWPIAQYNLGLVQLLMGDFENGWVAYEHRLKVPELASSRRKVEGVAWNGEPIQRKRIFIHAEQGLGDLIQFVRYVPMLAERKAKVILQCPAPLLRLFQCIGGVESFVSTGTPPKYDFHCPLLSLPRLFGTGLHNIPADVPYLLPDSDLVSAWKPRMGDAKLKVGLVWAGRPQHANDRNRSLPLSALTSLGDVSDVSFFSLQKGPPAAQVESSGAPLRLIDFTNELNDFADTAAAISNLDLIITADTAAAHLAGAMGRPVWVLLPFVPDWRWMMDREDSPWYPTMRLFRQTKLGDWAGVVERVVQELRKNSQP